MKKRMFIRKDEEGVTPVIATILMVAITVVLAAVLYIMVMGLGGGGTPPPRGTFQPPVIKSSTEVNIDFGVITPEQRPMNLGINIESNDTKEGRYSFSSNDEGYLAFVGGTDVCDIRYTDLADNQWVNYGDGLRITSLSPGTEYKVTLIWTVKGDAITSTTFMTPSA